MNTLNSSLTLILSAQVILIGFAFFMMPRWTRRGLFFAVTVDPSFPATEPGQDILKTYRRRTIVFTLLCAVLACGLSLALSYLVALLMATPQVLGNLLLFLAARRQVQPHSQEADLMREASLTTQQEHLPGGLLAQAGPFLLLLTAGAALALSWNGLPETLIVHWNAALEPDDWAPKSLTSIAMPLALAASVCLTMQILARSLISHARRVDTTGAGSASERARRAATAKILLIASYFTAAVLSLISLTPLTQEPGASKALMTVILVASVLGSLGLVFYCLVDGKKYFDVAGRQAESPGDRSNDSNWKWGLLYYNPEDPAIWAEKRVGIGYTFNMARPLAWATLSVLTLLPLAVIVIFALVD